MMCAAPQNVRSLLSIIHLLRAAVNPRAQYSGGAQSKDLKAGVSEGVLFDYRLAVNKL